MTVDNVPSRTAKNTSPSNYHVIYLLIKLFRKALPTNGNVSALNGTGTLFRHNTTASKQKQRRGRSQGSIQNGNIRLPASHVALILLNTAKEVSQLAAATATTRNYHRAGDSWTWQSRSQPKEFR